MVCSPSIDRLRATNVPVLPTVDRAHDGTANPTRPAYSKHGPGVPNADRRVETRVLSWVPKLNIEKIRANSRTQPSAGCRYPGHTIVKLGTKVLCAQHEPGSPRGKRFPGSVIRLDQDDRTMIATVQKSSMIIVRAEKFQFESNPT
jgi:hypothetical protein